MEVKSVESNMLHEGVFRPPDWTRNSRAVRSSSLHAFEWRFHGFAAVPGHRIPDLYDGMGVVVDLYEHPTVSHSVHLFVFSTLSLNSV